MNILNFAQYIPSYKRKDKIFDWLEQLHHEITALHTTIKLWNIFNDKYKANLSSELINWCKENYYYKVVLQISKLAEYGKRKDDRSLINFLHYI